MRLDSCRQCVRRRIKCDATLPHCKKCLRRGLICSGTGLQYRFVYVHGVQARRPDADSNADDLNLEPVPTVTSDTLKADKASNDADIARVEEPCQTLQWFSPTASLDLLTPQLRMFFDHFSKVIAPAMVVIDYQSNGYRDIILPLATHDRLVQQAVIAVSALHIGHYDRELLRMAETSRLAVIKQLCHDAQSKSLDETFTLSTWTAIILLLVAETVTGSRDFVYLFNMLRRFMELSSCKLQQIDSKTGAFLLRQSRMFELFTPPFLSPNYGQAALASQLDLGFVQTPQPDTHYVQTADIVRHGIRLGRDLYLKEVQHSLTSHARWQAVEDIKQHVINTDQAQPGMHAFVWTYFIAGAASETLDHRQFFAERLKQIYSQTGMRNILATIDILENLVWKLPQGQNWTSSPLILNRTLIM